MKINRQEVYDKYSGHCAYCGCEITLKEMQVDHIISQRDCKPWNRDSPMNFDVDGLENLNPSCRSCNNYKNSDSLEWFRHNIELQQERLSRLPMVRLAERFGIIEFKPNKVVFYFELLEVINGLCSNCSEENERD